MLVIGSQALRQFLPVVRPYEPDLDVMTTMDEMQSFCHRYSLNSKQLADYKWQVSDAPQYGHIEFEILEESASGRAYVNYTLKQPAPLTKVYDQPAYVAPLEVLFSIKRSHRHYPRMWTKHIEDYLMLRDKLGEDKLATITSLREKETEERYGKLKTPSLAKNTLEFFNDTVSNRVFIHDDIHAVMAHREKPMFEYIKLSPEKVTCSKIKFFELSYEAQLQCVLEEAYVIALERAIIPMLYEGKALATGESAFEWALMRICTTLCSGFFREFATENYREIKQAHDLKYVQKFLSAVENGRISRIK